MKILSWAVAVALVSLLVSGCSTSGSASGKLRATGENYPLSWVIQQVGGDRVSVDTLVPPGAEPHGYELSPQQVTALGRNDLVVYVRTLASAVDDGIKQAPPKASIDLTSLLPTRPAVDESTGKASTTGAAGIDPHLWLNPASMVKVADAVASRLAGLDPAGSSTYETNAKAVDARLNTLSSQFRSGLAHCATTDVIVTHPAFGYLTDQYGLTQVGVSGVDEDTEPSPARILEIAKVARQAKATTIFYADTSNPKIAEAIAGGIGAKTAQLIVLESQAPAGQDYVSAMQHNLSALESGLGCS